jgi:hypothetical protein
MSAAWISACVATAMAFGVIAGALWRGGRRDGKIDAVLEELTRIASDHETRLRVVERTWIPQHRRRS